MEYTFRPIYKTIEAEQYSVENRGKQHYSNIIIGLQAVISNFQLFSSDGSYIEEKLGRPIGLNRLPAIYRSRSPN